MSSLTIYLIAAFSFSAVVFGIDYLLAKLIAFHISRGNVPRPILDFPEYSVDLESYVDLKKKANEFVDSALLDQSATISFSAQDINLMNTMGTAKSKYSPGKHYHYEISEGKVVEVLLEHPVSFFQERSGCSIEKVEILYSFREGTWIQISRFHLSSRKTYEVSLYHSSLVLMLFDFNRYAYLRFRSNEVESQRALDFVKKISTVSISDSELSFSV